MSKTRPDGSKINGGPCDIDGCPKIAVARGWCHGHYARWKKTGNPLPCPTQRSCYFCDGIFFALGNRKYCSDNLSIDHDHACCPEEQCCGNCVRGLLCQKCNSVLGYAGDSIDVLVGAIRYLENRNVLTET